MVGETRHSSGILTRSHRGRRTLGVIQTNVDNLPYIPPPAQASKPIGYIPFVPILLVVRDTPQTFISLSQAHLYRIIITWVQLHFNSYSKTLSKLVLYSSRSLKNKADVCSCSEARSSNARTKVAHSLDVTILAFISINTVCWYKVKQGRHPLA